MNVALCDDDVIFLDYLENKLSDYNCQIFKYSNTEDIKNSTAVFDIAFLDIEFTDNETGFDVVRFLRMKNDKCIVSFFTNYAKYAIKGYRYDAFRYILKKEPEQLINKYIKEVFTEYFRRHKVIKGSYKDKSFAVYIDDILYIEVYNHILIIHTKKGTFELYKQIKDIENELCDFGFIRCHRSYMVNCQQILFLRSDGFFILNTPEQTCIPIGIRYREYAKGKYMDYVGGR